MQCKGITVNGARCKLAAKDGYCRYHKKDSTASGYIYAYTLRSYDAAHVYNHTTQQFEPLRATGLKKLLFWRRKPKQILVKVGFTTNEPSVRIDQWQKQCGHSLLLIAPKSRDAPRFDRQHNGWRCREPHSVEHAVHNKLRARFGRGKVQCSCKQGQGIHLEWFLVPRQQLPELCRLIDQVVSV